MPHVGRSGSSRPFVGAGALLADQSRLGGGAAAGDRGAGLLYLVFEILLDLTIGEQRLMVTTHLVSSLVTS